MSINVLFPVSSNNTKLTIFRSHLTLPKEDWVAGKCQKKKKKKNVKSILTPSSFFSTSPIRQTNQTVDCTHWPPYSAFFQLSQLVAWTGWLPTFSKSSFVFNRRHKIIQVWNNMSKWWQNVNFWVIPVRVFSIINHTDVFFFVCVIMTGWLYSTLSCLPNT